MWTIQTIQIAQILLLDVKILQFYPHNHVITKSHHICLHKGHLHYEHNSPGIFSRLGHLEVKESEQLYSLLLLLGCMPKTRSDFHQYHFVFTVNLQKRFC